ncbi:MAG: hypothetical protein ABH824_02960 [Nanoarchaeota archaeon]
MAEKTSVTPQTPGFDNAKLYLWVKGLEGKVNNILREVDLLKNDFIKRNNRLNKEIKTINDDFLEIKHEQEKMMQKMDLVIKELKKTAGIEEVMTIKKYLEFWNPINFVTQKDLDRAIESRMDLLSKQPINKKNIIKEGK